MTIMIDVSEWDLEVCGIEDIRSGVNDSQWLTRRVVAISMFLDYHIGIKRAITHPYVLSICPILEPDGINESIEIDHFSRFWNLRERDTRTFLLQ